MVTFVVPLSQTQIDIAGQLHQRLEQWRLSDMALRRLRQALPHFDDETCLLKSIVVNQLYGTQVLAIIPMSRHVKRILSGVGATERGAELVDEIAAFTHNGKLRQCISFAAKFCHFFVDENRFPIYDEAVRQAIKLHIGDNYVSGNNAPYATFCNNLGRLLAAVGFRGPSRDIDRYLWIVGMYMRWNNRRLNDNPQINAELLRLFKTPSPDEKAALSKLLPKCLQR